MFESGLAPSHPGRRAARAVLPSDLQSIVHAVAAATFASQTGWLSALWLAQNRCTPRADPSAALQAGAGGSCMLSSH